MPTDLTAFGLPADLPDFSGPEFGPPALGSPTAEPEMNLTRRQKAAVIVRLLLSDGRTLALDELPEHLQIQLTRDMGKIRKIDQGTLDNVAREFIEALEGGGLSFNGGLQEALSILEGSISADTAAKLSKDEGVELISDPWKRLVEFPPEKLLPLVEAESPEVGAVLMSKLSTEKAAAILGMLPGERARRIAYGVSITSSISPKSVRTIGRALLAQLDAIPRKAFEASPVDRVGAILNSSTSATRDAVLLGLEEEDIQFAERVRKAIFTFANIATRVDPRDVTKVTRVVDQEVLTKALKAAQGDNEASAKFLLANMSKRMAEQLEEEIKAMGELNAKAADEAMDAVVAGIRELVNEGTISFLSEEDE